MYSLWKHYDKEYERYEKDHPLAYPWHKGAREDVARYCSLSVSHLRSKFLKVTGLTIIGYRDKLRIDAAKELLQCGYFDIGEISTELGYCDVYHFSKAFKKYVGLSPTKWLKTQ